MKKLGTVLLLVLLCGVQLPGVGLASMGDGEGLYPITRPIASPVYGQTVTLLIVDKGDALPGHFGWLSWNGSGATEDLAVSLTPPGNSPTTYFNPGTPQNGWTPNRDDNHVSVGDWVQGLPGRRNEDVVTARLDWHIAHKTPLVIPLYDAVSGQGSNAYYHVAAFAAFELQSYDLSGKAPSITGKFLRWVTSGGW